VAELWFTRFVCAFTRTAAVHQLLRLSRLCRLLLMLLSIPVCFLCQLLERVTCHCAIVVPGASDQWHLLYVLLT